MMAGLEEKPLLERWITPAAVISITTAVVGQLLYTVWWARGESSRITANELAIANMRQDIWNLNTPLSSRVFKLESADDELRRMFKGFETTIDRNSAQTDRLAERLVLMDKRLVETDARAAQATALGTQAALAVDRRLDAFEKRLAELIAVISHPLMKLQSEESRPYQLDGPK